MGLYQKREITFLFIFGIVTGMLLNCYIHDATFNDNDIQAPHNRIDYKINGSNIILLNASLQRTTGISMRPTMFTGNKAIIVDYDGGYLKEGQIIIYKDNDNRTMVHRIKALYNNYLYVQGDNNDFHEKIKYDQIESVVIGILYN